jgi:hypothetical protein
MIVLQNYFTAARIAKVIESAPPLELSVSDALFPANLRQNHEQPLIPLSEIRSVVDAVPVVSRGGSYVPLDGTTMDNQYIEPLPIRVESKLDATQLNNLKVASNETRESWARRKVLTMRSAVRKTMEALAAQAGFNAKIAFPLLEDSGKYATYNVSYGGNPTSVTVAASEKWSHADMTLLKAYNFLSELDTKVDQGGYGGKKIRHVGAGGFAALLALAEKASEAGKDKVPFRLNDDGSVSVGGITIKKMAETYKDPKTGNAVAKLDDGEIRVNASGGTGFFYGPVDDLDGNLEPMPMFVKIVKHPTRGHLLLGESKPMPCIAPKSVGKATIL